MMDYCKAASVLVDFVDHSGVVALDQLFSPNCDCAVNGSIAAFEQRPSRRIIEGMDGCEFGTVSVHFEECAVIGRRYTPQLTIGRLDQCARMWRVGLLELVQQRVARSIFIDFVYCSRPLRVVWHAPV